MNTVSLNTVKLLLVIISASPLAAMASTCFNFAETYYQQIYCEIKASGKGSGLPSFLDFRRNNEQMQALLLKPHARKAGIELKFPKKTTPVAVATKTLKTSPLPDVNDCKAIGISLHCEAGEFQLVVNKPNTQLATGVLAADYRMNLPVFVGNREHASDVDAYLRKAYSHYLNKMGSIGLGGATISYGKFAYLFEDLAGKGFDFSDRFEVMFNYLKADKRKLAVPVRRSLPAEFDVEQCFSLGERLVCQAGMVNLVFTRR